MRKSSLLALAFVGLTAAAQSADPVIMTVNGKPVTRAEFEYSYNKNSHIEGAVEHKTVDEYAEMFLNYKLKVVAAEAARIDTTEAFRKEFLQYRDLQLTPYMVDRAYVDSVAHGLYDRTVKQLDGKDMLRPAHILLLVKQSDSDAVKARVAATADSLSRLAAAGADFADLARRFSKDPGSAARGGELPWIGPGMTLKPFEDAAYALQAGQVSGAVESSVGYHVIKMLERKQLEPFDTLYPEICKSLKRQGVEEASAEARIQHIVAASGGRLTREAVLDSVLTAHERDNADLRYLVQEYHDGLLLYEVSQQHVWKPAEKDTEAMARMFKANKKKYAWSEPRYKGYVVHAKSDKALRAAVKLVKRSAEGDLRKVVDAAFNADSTTVRVMGPYFAKKGENRFIDAEAFGGEKAKPFPGFSAYALAGKVLKQPKTYTDVKTEVQADCCKQREEEWVAELRRTFPYSIDRSVLATVNKH